jgi:putative protease
VEAFGIKRVVLPRVLTVTDIEHLNREIGVETEVFAFGGMCPMAEGRCSLSSYATGRSPNTFGVCSPASHVHYEQRGTAMVSRLGNFTINVFAADETAGYPTLCKGRFSAAGNTGYLFEEPVSLNAADLLPALKHAGVTAIKIEGRQRGRAYIARVVSAFRALIEADNTGTVAPNDALTGLRALAEGQRETAGAYRRSWR